MPPSPPSPPTKWVAKPARKALVVGMGDMLASNDTSAQLVTYSLGSCVGIVIYDPVKKVGGMLHAMLPDSSINPARAQLKPYMFVDTGLPALFDAVYSLGGVKSRLSVKVAGGAQFLDEKKIFNIGQRNTDQVMLHLSQNGVLPSKSIIGGRDSRTLKLDLGTGELLLDVPGNPLAKL